MEITTVKLFWAKKTLESTGVPMIFRRPQFFEETSAYSIHVSLHCHCRGSMSRVFTRNGL